jgi:HAE1 family hydrophobic/amphiphilic exporter-1
MRTVRTAIRRPVTVSMFVVAVCLFGAVSVDRLSLDLLPDISYPSLTIQTEFEDAAPEEVEALVTRPVEENVGVVPGLSRISSISRPGQSEVILEFGWDTDMDLAVMDVREKLDLANLPTDAEKPVILRFDPAYDPVMRLHLYGDAPLSRVRDLAERKVKQGLESTSGVAAVKVAGGREEQIRIEIDEKRLAELNIPVSEVSSVIREANLNQASGSLYDLDANYLVRVLNEFQSVEEIRNLIVRNLDGRQVVLGDVARVWRGTKERDVISRFNGRESVELRIYKEGDANAVAVSEAVRERLEQLKQQKTYPGELTHEIVYDQAQFINLAVRNVAAAALLGGLLATLVLFVFLRDLRSTATIGLSIPISVMATFTLMYQTGVTLNIMSLGGVALGVGMLVDNSIVVLESIHRHRRRNPDLAEAVYQGTREVGQAVAASTLTTVAVFLPLIFVEGIAGQLFKDQALTITYSLLASLAVALTVIPMVLSRRRIAVEPVPQSGNGQVPAAGGEEGRLARLIRAAGRGGARVLRFLTVDLVLVVVGDLRRLLRTLGRGLLKPLNPLLGRFDSGFESLRQTYPRFLAWSLDHKGSVLALTLGLVGASAGLAQFLGAELIPSLVQGKFSFEIQLPQGKPLEETDRIIRQVESQVLALDGVATVFSSVGGGADDQFATGPLEEHRGWIHVSMEDGRDKAGEERVIGRTRSLLGQYPGLTHLFGRPTLFSFREPVEVEIYSYDLAQQRSIAEKVMARLSGIDGLADVQSSTRLGNPEVRISFRREQLARLGLDESQAAEILRSKIRGDVASRYRDQERQLDILVQAAESDRDAIEDVRDLVINTRLDRTGAGGNRRGTGDGARSGEGGTRSGSNPARTELESDTEEENSQVPIRLGSVAQVQLSRGPGEIRRMGSQRAAVVSANLTGADLGTVSRQIEAELSGMSRELPPDAVVTLGGQHQEYDRSRSSLLFALALAVLLVYLVMASQFESLVHPFVILFTVPVALVGVVAALFVTGSTVSVMVLLGVIILVGIVVNNGIVLIDYTNQLRHRGLSRREALIEAGQVRLRPILMTTLTTVLGLLPMALGWGEGSEVRTPMAITVMGGLLFATLLTLILVPVLYEGLDRKAETSSHAG